MRGYKVVHQLLLKTARVLLLEGPTRAAHAMLMLLLMH